jgi:hypothetical protein
VNKFICGDPYREFLAEVLTLFETRRTHKWLSNDRQNAAIPPEDLERLKQQWVPKAVAAGWQYWAVALPQKMVGRLSIQRMVNYVVSEQTLVAQTFTKLVQARSWLGSC